MWNRPGKFKIFRILCQDEVIEKQGVPRVTIYNNEHIVFTKRSTALSKRVHFIGKNTGLGNAALPTIAPGVEKTQVNIQL